MVVYVDDDRDGTRDSSEPQDVATAYWREQRDVDPPTAGTPTRPNGDPVDVTVNTTINPANPEERYFQISAARPPRRGSGRVQAAGPTAGP